MLERVRLLRSLCQQPSRRVGDLGDGPAGSEGAGGPGATPESTEPAGLMALGEAPLPALEVHSVGVAADSHPHGPP